MATQLEGAAHICLDLRRFKGSRCGRFHAPSRWWVRSKRGRKRYIKHLQEVAAGRSEKSVRSPDDPRERRAAAEAGIRELDLARKRGDVAIVRDVVDAVQHEYGLVRDGLMNVPARLADALSSDQIERVAEEIAACLELLHDPDGLIGGLTKDRPPVASADGPQAAAKARPRRAGRAASPHRKINVRDARKVANRRPARGLRTDAGDHFEKDTHTVSLKCSTQLMKTEIVLNTALYFAHQDRRRS